jgi:membrane-associated phospholipid phosphatase
VIDRLGRRISASWLLGDLVLPRLTHAAWSRVYTGVHYPSDVVAGAALGLGAAVVVARLSNRPAE